MKNYKAISCGAYDKIEEIAISGKTVLIRYKLEINSEDFLEINSQIKTTSIDKTGEYIVLEVEEAKIRMDLLLSIDDWNLIDSTNCQLP